MNIPTLVINLDKDTVNLAQAKSQLNSFIRIPAVLGSTAKKESSTLFCQLFCTDSMIGCMLSHIKCWQYIVDQNIPYAIILEDDFVLDQSTFYQKVNQLISNTPKNWDVILLGCFLCDEKENDLIAKFFMSIHAPFGKRRPINDFVYKPKTWSGTHAYVLNINAAKKLLYSLPRASYHVDYEMSKLENLNLYAAVHPFVRQNTVGGSNNTVSVPILNVLPRFDKDQINWDFILTMPMIQCFGFKIHMYFLLKIIMLLIILRVLRSNFHYQKG